MNHTNDTNEGGHMQNPIPTRSFMDKHRFVVLFFIMQAFCLIVPVSNHFFDVLQSQTLLILEHLFFVMVLAGAVFTVSTNRAHLSIALCLGVPAILLSALRGFLDITWVEFFRHFFGLAFLVYAIVLIFAFIFSSQRITFNTVCASLCIYLLVGLVWALAYSWVDQLNPASFRWTVSNGAGSDSLRFGSGASTAVLYYSFSTLTTLGYGDIVPISPIARALAMLEAIFGQIYLAVLVARLVGLNIAESMARKSDSPHI